MQGHDADIEDLVTLRAVALEAGNLALDYLHRGELKTWDKTHNHPVTEADIAVNDLIRDRLMTARPTYGWLSEETVLDKDTRAGERVWVVDPIDGTRAFMRGEPHWCIGLGVLHGGRSQVGMVHAPQLRQTYEARRGGGAYLNGRLIEATRCDSEVECRLIASEAMLSHPSWCPPWPRVVLADPKPNATLLRMCWVASGAWDATIALARKSDWDLAPATIIVAEAGGQATTHLGEPYQFNRAEPAQRSLLAAGKALHSLLSERVNGVRLPDPNPTPTRPDAPVSGS